MNKETCEKMLMQTLKIAVCILQNYNPEADYLNMAFVKDENGAWFHVQNANDKNFPIEAEEMIKKEVIA